MDLETSHLRSSISNIQAPVFS